MNIHSKIAILGYGIEGQSTERYLKKHGYQDITILDEKPISSSSQQISGKKIWESLHNFDVIFRSPGISPLRKEIIELPKNINLTSHTELFFERCPSKIIGVTGTKGKGTTSALINKIIENSGKKCFLGGNIGIPPLEFLDELTNEDYVVLELSSFQTFTLNHSPHIAVILMVTQEHLDYHKNIQEYWEAKAQLVKNQKKEDYIVYHTDYKGSCYVASHSQAQKTAFSPNFQEESTLSKSFLKESSLYYGNEKIIKLSEIALIGKHNWNNILAAIHVAKILQIPTSIIKNTLKHFTGLPLRLEKIAEKDGIIFINDSFSTTPETSIAAIEAFPKKNIAILLGGSEKGSDYSLLIETIGKNKKIIPFCYGKTGPIFFEAFQKINKTSFLLTHMQDAFQKGLAFLKTKKTGVLLLSPACASFDEFKNYKERGEQFNKQVKSLPF